MAESAAAAEPDLQPLPKRPRTTVEEVYTRWYVAKGGGEDGSAVEDMYVYCHPNGLALVGATAAHALCGAAGPSGPGVRVDFTKGGKAAAPQQRSGKKARGGVQLQPESVLCHVAVGDGEGERVFKLRACVRGLLLETSQRLAEEPELLASSPQDAGHVAIVKLQAGEEARLRGDGGYLAPAAYAQLRGLPLDSLGM
mmetsp:Transcript_11297/g.28956  ORF Transcript_11297/g.28956 Transcript_11297/m.28956 type:complete len:197 (-) Transcript_11297:15-605(-)|eukprot:jgi/Tetstr1/453053/TSEL_040089.t1